MNFQDLEQGDVVELEVKQASTKVSLKTTIEFKIDDMLLLEPVRIDGKVAGFSDNVAVNLLFPRESKLNIWYNIKVSVVKYNKNIYHAIKLEGDSTTLNRRQAYRVYMGHNHTIVTFTSTGPKNLDVLVRDVSDLGFAFITGEAMNVGNVVRLHFPIDDSSELKLTAKIVRTESRERGETLYGCKFSERNRILSEYLMKYQREKAKGKIS